MTHLTRPWLLALVALPILAVATVLVWVAMTGRPMPEATLALQSDDRVTVTTDRWLKFAPAAQEPKSGLILYPGGFVHAAAYAPAARALAARGHLVVIVPMPLNLAVLAPDRANQVMTSFPALGRWAVGGHSLGGAMAAGFARRHPGSIEALVLWAAYPPAGDDLSGADLAVLSIYATEDGLATPDDIDASRPLLPLDTRFVKVEGGNHAQFGWYGPQRGDNPAQITRAEQQKQVVEATAALLTRLDALGMRATPVSVRYWSVPPQVGTSSFPYTITRRTIP